MPISVLYMMHYRPSINKTAVWGSREKREGIENSVTASAILECLSLLITMESSPQAR